MEEVKRLKIKFVLLLDTLYKKPKRKARFYYVAGISIFHVPF